MGKDKIRRFRELETLERVIQPSFEEVFRKDHHLKGLWVKEIFGNGNPLVLELGCGKGEYTVGMARKYPERNFLGLDIKGARIWKGAVTAHGEELGNVAFLRTRIEFINSFFAPGEVSEIWITFPDPQEKKRRQKKRLTGAIFLNYYRQFLVDGGRIHLKTDNAGLFAYTLELVRYNNLELLQQSDDLDRDGTDGDPREIRTYYEQRFRAEGIPIKYLCFSLPAGNEILELPDEEAGE